MRGTLNASLLSLLLVFNTAVLAGPSAGERLEALNQAIQADPGNGLLYLRRAYAHSELLDFQRAAADLDLAEQHGRVAEASLMRGDYFIQVKDWEKAKQQYDRVLALQPENTSARIYRAKARASLGDIKGAAVDYKQLIAINPELDSGQYRAAARLIAQAEGVEKALTLLDQRMQSAGPIPQLQNLAIELEVANKQYARAISRLYAIKAIGLGTPFWHVRVAELQLLDGKPGKTVYHLNIARDLLKTYKPTGAVQRLSTSISDLEKQVVTH